MLQRTNKPTRNQARERLTKALLMAENIEKMPCFILNAMMAALITLDGYPDDGKGNPDPWIERDEVSSITAAIRG